MEQVKKDSKGLQHWTDIMVTLLTLELMAFFYYGTHALANAVVCTAVSFTAEVICARLMNRHFSTDDLWCISDALTVSLMMPAVMDYRISAIACIFSVTLAKNVFGGKRNMIFSPPAAAYIFTLVSWKTKLLQYTPPHVHTDIFAKAENLVDSASRVYNLTGKMNYTDFEILMGNFSGPCGAVSILLLIVSAVILILRKDISAGAFTGTVTGTALFAYLTPLMTSELNNVKYSLVTNMVLFSAVYIVSDLRVVPKSNFYAFFYGLFIAVFSYILVLTTALENAVVIISVLFAPLALAMRNLERTILNESISEKNSEGAETA